MYDDDPRRSNAVPGNEHSLIFPHEESSTGLEPAHMHAHMHAHACTHARTHTTQLKLLRLHDYFSSYSSISGSSVLGYNQTATDQHSKHYTT